MNSEKRCGIDFEAVPPHMTQSNPYDTAGVWSLLTFSWPLPLLELGYKKVLEHEHLPPPPVDDCSEGLLSRFLEAWNVEVANERPRLVRALYHVFVGKFGWIGILGIIECFLKVWQAMLLGSLIAWIVDEPGTGAGESNGWYLAGAITFSGACTIFLHHHLFMYVWRCGMQMRILTISVIFNKAIHLDLKSLAHTASGHVVNLASYEVEVLQGAGCFVHYLYIPLVETLVASIVGCWYIGPSFLVGVGLILCLVPLQGVFSRYLAQSRRETTAHTDSRLKTVNQALQGARLMKMNAWEFAMSDMITEARGSETAALLKTNFLRGMNEAIFFSAPVMVSAASLFTYSGGGGELATQDVFVVLVLMAMLQFSMCKFFSLSIEFWTQTLVTFGRIEKLLVLSEYNKENTMVETNCTESDIPDGAAIFLDKVWASWDTEMAATPTTAKGKGDDEFKEGIITDDEKQKIPQQMVLQDISLTVNKGDLVVIVGPVGSSKSSLLYVLLRELVCCEKPDSKLFIDPNRKGVGYCSQEPWIMSTTVRENILFGQAFVQARYDRICEVCALTKDLSSLQHGDQTIIGDKGVNLSGGQRARVGLARALYAEKDIVLLDDPLSAVDAKVSRHIFEKAICGELQGKTRVLVTHQVQYLSSDNISNIVVMADGRVKTQGKYKELLERGDLDWVEGTKERAGTDDWSESGRTNGLGGAGVQTAATIPSDGGSALQQVTIPTPPQSRAPSESPGTGPGDVDIELAAAHDKAKFEGKANIERGLIIAEDREAGFVRKTTYLSYIEHMGGIGWCIALLLIMAIAQGFQVATNLYLAQWSAMSAEEQRKSEPYIIYGMLVLGTAIGAVCRSYLGFRSAVLASYSLHNSMLKAVVRAPVLFFDQNPLGRVLNRFAKDIGCVDDQLPMVLFDFIQCCLMVASAIVIACAAVPYTFLCLIPLIWYFLRLRTYYLATSREIKRLDGMSRSPILGILTESLGGLSTVRAYKRQDDFGKTHRSLLDDNTRAYFMFIACSRWLGSRLDAIVVSMLLISSFGAVVAKESGAAVDPNLLAVGMLYVIQLTGLFQWCVRQSCEVENLMTSVERVLGFTNLPPEPALHGPTDMTSRKDWPEEGAVNIEKLVCTYRSDLEPVIKGLTLKLAPGKRCGVVGRTGAGKSTLVAALLRLVDSPEGKIEIDGVDIANVGLHDLRPKMSVIPQTPFLFSGTLRQNLDPFSDYSDEQIWSAIDACGAITRKTVEHMGGGLAGIVEDNGNNFSVGERQLLCLARAVLTRNKLVILDEATASLDNETDAAVQEAIRTSFAKSTVIIIAHRLQTVMDCEQLVVMSHGKVVEAGHPHLLLSKYFGDTSMSSSSSGQLADSFDKDESRAPPRESLAGMVRETGALMMSHIRKAAFAAYQKERSIVG